MARKVYCKNTSCKHHCENNSCDTIIKIGETGKCLSFEKGFTYYFHIVWEALSNKNYIDMAEIERHPDLRIGLYYIMECYDLGFSEVEWGFCRMVMLKDKENGKGLKYEEIIAKNLNNNKFMEHYENFNAGIMPEIKNDEETKTELKEFGWLSPMGEFTESPFGQHEESAEIICKKHGFVDEYWEWVENTDDEIHYLMRDFLAEVKGYCLIHNPSGYNGYIVTHTRNLTKKQKEFLYAYFIDMGDKFKAEQFL